MTEQEVAAEALRVYPWCFPPHSDVEDATRRAMHKKPRCGGDWEPTRQKALEQVRQACRKAA